MSRAPVVTEGHVEDWGLGWPPWIMSVSEDCATPRAMLNWGATWSHGDIGNGLLPRAMSGSVALQKLGSKVISMAPVVTKGSVDAQDLASQVDDHRRCCCWDCANLVNLCWQWGNFGIWT